jgi:hypothetical protein
MTVSSAIMRGDDGSSLHGPEPNAQAILRNNSPPRTSTLTTSLKQHNSDEVERFGCHNEALRIIIQSASFRVVLSLLKVTSLTLLPTLLRAFFQDVR